MIPDMRTVMLLYAITNVVCAVFIAILYNRNRHFAGVSLWLIDMVLQAIGVILIVLRGIVPDFFSIIISNTMIISGILIIYIGLERFIEKKSSQIHNYILVGVFISIHVYFTYIRPSLDARSYLIFAMTLILTFQIAYLMLRRASPSMRSNTRIVGIVFSGYVFISIIRVIFLAIFPLNSNDFFKSGASDTFIIIFYIMLAMGLVYGLIIMVNGRFIDDINIYTKQRDDTANELKESEEKYRTLVEKANEAILIVQDGNFVFSNPRVNEFTGLSDKDFMGKSFVDFVWPEDRKMVAENYRKRIGGEPVKDYYDYRIIGINGNPIWVLMSVALIQYNGRPATLIMATDINERKKAEVILKQQTEAIEAAVDGIAILDKKEQYTNLNKSHAKIYGYNSPMELIGKSWTILYDNDELKRFKNDIMPKLNRDGYWHGEAIGLKKDGSKFFQELSLTVLSDGGMICIVRNIDKRKKRENEIIYLSYHDKLTELYNRRFIEEELIRYNNKSQLPISIIMGDLNSLKLTNDTFGHNVGDMLLKEISKLLRKVSRSDDILARWGGDEFVMLLPKTSATGAEGIVARIKKECTNLAIQKIPLSLAIGIATKTEEAQDMDKIIAEAEGNMYKSKLVEKESNASSIIFALEQTLFEKSIETFEHTLRIKDNALKLGKVIKLTSNQLDELSILSSLHDIGKVAIPETLLLKNSKPTEEEWVVIKRHTETGFNIAQSSPQIAHIAKFILACHENWDGSGYPNGLKGEAIPIVSRVLFICDAYDVMTNERSYKKAMSKKEAIEELRRCSGTQFDPVLVEKFIKVLSK
jgi:diguanylate cyclase (GGDEF)-like protein/PAS domain S-box-containing protein